MKNQDIIKKIAELHTELNTYLAIGDRESLVKSVALLNNTWDVLINKDDGLRYTYRLLTLWMDEVSRSEHSILSGVHSVNAVIEKCKLIRHAFFRLENDFPSDMCLEGLKIISDMHLSQTAFQDFLKREVEDGEKVILRISEITKELSS